MRWLLVSLALLAFGVVGILRTPSTNESTLGTVAGFGFRMDGEECYLTVAYTVEGERFHFQSPHESRWCDYQPLYRQAGSIMVFYDSSDHGTATLTPRGDLPMTSTLIGLAGLGACCVYRVRRPRRSGRPPQSASPSPTLAH
jgi:hypothetical protein